MEWILTLTATIVVAYLTAQWTADREREKLREQLKLEHSVERAIIQLLGKQGWELRSFKTIKYHIRGFDDETLRQYLVRSGAIAFEDEERDDPEKRERWGLLEKNIDRLHRAP